MTALNTANVDRARQLVASTQVLNQAEKLEWGQLIPLMNDHQVDELVSILTPPAPVVKPQPAPVPTPVPVKPAAPPFKLNVNLAEKDLPPGLPIVELDLPAPRPTPPVPPPAPVVKPQPPVPPPRQYRCPYLRLPPISATTKACASARTCSDVPRDYTRYNSAPTARSLLTPSSSRKT